MTSARWLLLGVLTLAVAPAAPAQEDNPIVALVKSKGADPAKPFALVIRFKAKDGAKLEEAFRPAIRETRKEKGCVSYDLNRDPDDAAAYLLYERWKTVADLEAHLKSPHITKLLGELATVTDGPPDLKVMLPAAD
jgi:quinol monooxygenase YgiN